MRGSVTGGRREIFKRAEPETKKANKLVKLCKQV